LEKETELKNFDYFIKNYEGTTVELKYRVDTPELLKKWNIEIMNNQQDYKYLMVNGWVDLEPTQKDTWTDQIQIVEHNGYPVGYIKWDLFWQFPRASEQGLFLLKEHQKFEIAMVALRKWADHCLLERKLNKISVSCCPLNKNLYTILEECQKVGLTKIGTRKKHYRLLDGSVVDCSLFELHYEDYVLAMKDLVVDLTKYGIS